MRQDSEASEGVVTTSRSGGSNMRTQRHYACNYPFLFEEEGMFLSH